MPVPQGIPFDEYRRDVGVLTVEEERFRSEFAMWLPPVVIDAHVHNALPEHILFMPERSLRHMASTFPWSTVSESRQRHAMLFPGAKVRCLRFAHAHPGVDHAAVNDWLEQEIEGSGDKFALFGLQSDVPGTIQQLRGRACAALKMYHLVTDPPGATIRDVFPEEVLAECERLQIPIILHLPRQITDSIDDVCETASSFPSLRIVLAHLGLPNYLRPGLSAAYERIAGLSNVYMDTACMEYADVVELALRSLGPERIMYGSDDPISLLRATPYVHPTKGPRVVPNRPMHWTDPAEFVEFGHLGAAAVMNHWQQLLALRTAFDRCGYDKAFVKRRVMHDNAATLYAFETEHRSKPH